MTLDQQFEAAGVTVEHFFSTNEYAKKTMIPAGLVLTQHKHTYDHLSVLASGRALVEVDGSSREITGPECLVIEASKEHKVTAITDICWFCIHSTSCKDPAMIDSVLIKEN